LSYRGKIAGLTHTLMNGGILLESTAELYVNISAIFVNNYYLFFICV